MFALLFKECLLWILQKSDAFLVPPLFCQIPEIYSTHKRNSIYIQYIETIVIQESFKIGVLLTLV